MKITFTFLVAALMMLAFTGCSNSNSSSEELQKKKDSLYNAKRADSLAAANESIEKFKIDSTFFSDSLVKITSYYTTPPNSALSMHTIIES